MPERRERRRVSLLAQVESGTVAHFSIGRVQNISEGGLFVKTPDTFDPTTEITVRFNLPPIPHGRHIESMGVVIHAKPGVHMGIEFLQMKEEHRKAIAELVQASHEGDMEAAGETAVGSFSRLGGDRSAGQKTEGQ